MTKFREDSWIASHREPVSLADAIRRELARKADHPDTISQLQYHVEALENAFASLATVVYEMVGTDQQRQLVREILPCWEKVEE